MEIAEYSNLITCHYEQTWKGQGTALQWASGPRDDLPSAFRVLRFSPTASRGLWTYATNCMSMPDDSIPIELHLLSPVESNAHVELLNAIAHYHRTGARLDHGHTVDFGRPWLPGSECDCGLVSLPYLDGPLMERSYKIPTRFLWLIPITSKGRDFKKEGGLEALETIFDGFPDFYHDPNRRSIV
ncbi:suppressor of fused domain protein [bacterium]|nr:suppressor of fused domain protein [bacterium]